MAGVKLRVAKTGDAAGFAERVRASCSHYIKRIGRRPGPMLDDYNPVVRDYRACVIEEDGEILVALVLVEREDGLPFENIAVRPERQGEEIGRRLMEHAESVARRIGYGRLDSCTHKRMTENIAMYERIGHPEVERRAERGFPRV